MMVIEIARIKMQAKMVARGDVNLSLGYGDDRLDVADIVEEADALRKENDALKLRIAELQSMLDTLGGSD